jgi:two-component system sensor histidine kinase CpxA
MRVPLSIATRLLAGFFANLALLAFGFWLVFQAQFGVTSNQLFAGIAEPRVQALAERLGAELRPLPHHEWDRVLAAHSKALEMDFAVYDGEMRRFAGANLELPNEVMGKIIELSPHLQNRTDANQPALPEPKKATPKAKQAGEAKAPPATPQAPPPDAAPPAEPKPPRDGRPGPFGMGANPPAMDPELTSYPKITARTSDPSAYWVISRVPLLHSERGWLPLLLIMRSSSLTAGGVFFDPKPWLYAGLGVLVLSALIWVPLALGLTRSLWRLRTATGRIAEGDFAVDVPDAARADELGELGRSVKQMAQRLEGHVIGQKRFLGDIAHELCSPIARMQVSLGILEESVGDERQHRYLQKVSGEVQKMSALVNELLSFSKASLKREVSLTPVKLAPLVQEMLQREDADTTMFRVEVPDDIEVKADREMLGRAISNLVRNALRYAAHAGPVGIAAAKQNGRVLLVIRDHGPGVPPDQLPRLFDPFYRPDAARTRERGGVGLGLAIVKSCVEACQGSVALRNCEGGGLEVSLLLHTVEKPA